MNPLCRPKRSVVARIVRLTKIYQLGNHVQVRALSEVSLEFRRGDFVAIMGASGSGKSTLLNLLGCLDRPTSGQYILAGRDVAGSTTRRSRISAAATWASFSSRTI